MNTPKVSRDEQIRLIHECRTSGLSDSQWCLQHGIRPGTFYNWVSRIKKKGDVYIPDPGGAAELEIPVDLNAVSRPGIIIREAMECDDWLATNNSG